MSPQSDRYQLTPKGEVLIICFREVTGLATADLKECVLQDLISPEYENFRFVIVDCSELNYANSTFLETILGVKHLIESKNGSLALSGVKDVVGDVLRASHLNEICPSYASIDQAISALTS